MSEPLTYARIEGRLRACINAQESLIEEYEKKSLNAAYAESEFKRCLLSAKAAFRIEAAANKVRVTESMVEEAAEEIANPSRLDKEVSESQLRVVTEKLRSVRAEMDVLRTLAVSHRDATS